MLAFRGAPASFPVEEQNRQAHAFLKWSDKITKEVDDYIEKNLPSGPFVGIHLRNGVDWVRGLCLLSQWCLCQNARAEKKKKQIKKSGCYGNCFIKSNTFIFLIYDRSE